MTAYRSVFFLLVFLLVCLSVQAQDQNYTYGSFIGGNGEEMMKGVVNGLNDDTYFYGYTASTNLQQLGGSQSGFGGGFADGFAGKLNDQGQLAWMTYWGGNGLDVIEDIALTESGNLILAGRTSSTNFPVTNDAFQTILAGSEDGFLTMLDENHEIIWSTYVGGSASDKIMSVTIDDDQNIYCTGTTQSSNLATDGVHQIQLNNPNQAASFVAKFSPEGNQLWFTYFQGNAATTLSRIAFSIQNGSVIVAGSTTSNSGIALNAHQSSYSGGFGDGLLSAFDASNGTLLWSTYYGGSELDEVRDIVLKPDGSEIYFCGFSDSAENISTPGTHQETKLGASDAFIAAFSIDGARLWATYFGGESFDYGLSIDLSGSGISILGSTSSVTNIAFGNPLEPENLATPGGPLGSLVNFVTLINSSDGSVIWSTYFFGDCIAIGAGSHCHDGVKLKMSGSALQNYWSCEPFVTDNAAQQTFGGGSNDGGIFYLEDNYLSAVSTEELELLVAYPNPVSSGTTLHINSSVAGLDIVRLYNTAGIEVASFNLSAAGQLDISGIPAGLYLLRGFQSGRQVFFSKIVVI